MSTNINTPSLYLKMDAIIGTTSYDSSGNQYNATVDNAQAVPDNTFGNCTSFNGTDANLSLGETTLGGTLQNGTSAFSISVWIAPGALSSVTNAASLSNVFFCFGDNAMNSAVLSISTAGALVVTLSSNYTSFVFGTDELADEGWHFVALSVSGTTVQAYVDGNAFPAGTATNGTLPANNDNSIMVGSDVQEVSFFPGAMAHLRVYNTALEASDFTAVMNSDIANELMVYLPLSQSASGYTPNSSTYPYTAALLNSPVIATDPQFGTVMQLNAASSQYIALSGPEYTPGMALTEVTVQAWIKTSATSAMVIASFDPANYWELGLSVSGTSLVTSWTTVDENATVQTLTGQVVVNDNAWHFISASYHAGDGTKSIYVDGGLDVSVLAHSGLPLGNANGPVRYGFVGASSQASSFPGVATSGFFTGSICQFWLYHQALTPENIAADMNAGLTASSAYLLDYPLGFALRQENQLDTIFIYDVLDGQTLTLRIVNNASLPIQFDEVTDPVSGSNYQLAVVFRPGTLAAETVSSLTLSESVDWTMSVSTGTDGTVTLYLVSATGFTLYPMAALELTLNNVSAGATGGSRVTRVEFSYNNITYLGNDAPANGTTSIVVSIVNHAGSSLNPLHAAFLNTNTVWNGWATNSNSLAVRITNVLNASLAGNQQGIAFNGSETSTPTTFILYFQGESAPQADAGALNTNQVLGQIPVPQVNTSYSGGVLWTVKAQTQGSAPYWTFVPQTSFNLLPGQSLEIDISGIVADTLPGFCNMYIDFENLPGYLDNGFILEIIKSNIYPTGSMLGVGTSTPDYVLSINASNNGFDTLSTGELAMYVGGNQGLAMDESGNFTMGGTAGTPYLTVNSAGTVLNTPGLQVGPSGTPYLTVNDTEVTLDTPDFQVGPSGSPYLSLSSSLLSLFVQLEVDSPDGIISQGAIVGKDNIYATGNICINPGSTQFSILNILDSSGTGGAYIGVDNNSNFYLSVGPSATQHWAMGTLSTGEVGLATPPIAGTGLTIGSSDTTAIVATSGTSVTVNAPATNIQVNGSTVMYTGTNKGAGSFTIPPNIYVGGIPVLQWQIATIQLTNGSTQSGGKTVQGATLTFASQVVTAVAMLQGWSLSFGNDEYEVMNASVVAGCNPPSNNTVIPYATFLFEDDDNDEKYFGSATVVVLAWVSQSV